MSKKKKFKQLEEATAYLIKEVKHINSVLADITYWEYADACDENQVPKKYRYCDCQHDGCNEEKAELTAASWEAVHDIIMNEGSDIFRYIGHNCIQYSGVFNKERDMMSEIDLRKYMVNPLMDEKRKPKYIVNSRLQSIDFLTNADTTLMINLKLCHNVDAASRNTKYAEDVPITINFRDCICPSHAIKLIFSCVRLEILRRMKNSGDFNGESGAPDHIAFNVAEAILGLLLLSRMYAVLAENEHVEEFTETLLNTELPIGFHPDYNCFNFAFKCDTMKFSSEDTNLFILPITHGEAQFACDLDYDEVDEPDTDGEGIDLPESEG